jgi:hypothetical protein
MPAISASRGALHAAEGLKGLIAGYPVGDFEAPLRGAEGRARVYRIGQG